MGWPLPAKPERARERRNPPYFPPYPAYTQSLFQSGVNPLFRHYTPIACNAVVIAYIAFACSLIPYTYTLIFFLVHYLLSPYVLGTDRSLPDTCEMALPKAFRPITPRPTHQQHTANTPPAQPA